MAPSATVDMVRDIPLFRGMAADDLTALVGSAREEAFGANVPVVKEGEPGAAFYLILDGAVAVTKALEGGRVELINVLTQGDYFGEMALLSAAVRSASVVTLEPTRLLAIAAAAFDRFVRERPAGGAWLFRGFALTMSDRLRDLTEKLRGVAERGQAIRQDVGEMQSEIVAVAAHELQTPVAVLKGTTDMLAEVEMPPERRARFLQTMQQQAERLTALLADINQLVDLQQHPAPIARQPRHLQGILQAVLEELQPAMDRRRIAFSAEIPADLPPVPVAQEKIHKVLFHLLDNGVKYNRERGALAVLAKRVAGERIMVEVAVRDTGPGLSPAVAEQLGSVRPGAVALIARRPGEFGVGIALARKLVEAHGGKFWVESAAGAGATFYFTLPL